MELSEILTPPVIQNPATRRSVSLHGAATGGDQPGSRSTYARVVKSGSGSTSRWLNASVLAKGFDIRLKVRIEARFLDRLQSMAATTFQ